MFVLGSLAVGGASLGGFLGGHDWRLDQLAHFRVHYALALLTLTLGLLILRRRRWAMLPGVLVLVNAALIAPLYVPAAGGRSDASDAMRLLCFNIRYDNPNHDGVLDYIESSGADAVFLLEVTPAWLKALEAYELREDSSYRVVTVASRPDAFGIGMLALKMPQPTISVNSARIVVLSPDTLNLPSIEATITFKGRAVKVLATHPMPPVNRAASSRRDLQLVAAGQWVAASSEPAVIIGDFNVTPWSSAFRRLQRDTGMANSQRGFGYQATWPTTPGVPLGIPIDHCLHDPALTTTGRVIGPNLGSDHRAIFVNLAWSN